MNIKLTLLRLIAFFYDIIVVFALVILATSFFLIFTHGLAVTPNNHWYQAYLVAVIAAYWIGFWWKSGQTLGMLAWNIKVVNLQNQPLKFSAATLRFIAGATLSVIGLLFSLCNRNGATLYDTLSHSRVTYMSQHALQ